MQTKIGMFRWMGVTYLRHLEDSMVELRIGCNNRTLLLLTLCLHTLLGHVGVYA